MYRISGNDKRDNKRDQPFARIPPFSEPGRVLKLNSDGTYSIDYYIKENPNQHGIYVIDYSAKPVNDKRVQRKNLQIPKDPPKGIVSLETAAFLRKAGAHTNNLKDKVAEEERRIEVQKQMQAAEEEKRIQKEVDRLRQTKEAARLKKEKEQRDAEAAAAEEEEQTEEPEEEEEPSSGVVTMTDAVIKQVLQELDNESRGGSTKTFSECCPKIIKETKKLKIPKVNEPSAGGIEKAALSFHTNAKSPSRFSKALKSTLGSIYGQYCEVCTRGWQGPSRWWECAYEANTNSQTRFEICRDIRKFTLWLASKPLLLTFFTNSFSGRWHRPSRAHQRCNAQEHGFE